MDEPTFQIERQKLVLDCINREKRVSVAELSEEFGLSRVTIRKYLNELHSKGLIVKTHGGAISVSSELNYEIPYHKKTTLFIEEKRRIGAAAAELIDDGSVIIIDAGSTTFELARKIANRRLTVITNDIQIAHHLVMRPGIKLIIVGGEVQQDLYTAIGSFAESFLRQIHVNQVFLGADAIDIEHGITNRTLEETSVKKAMIAAASSVILLADHTKFDTQAFATVCPLKSLDAIVTDALPSRYEKHLSQNHVRTIIA